MYTNALHWQFKTRPDQLAELDYQCFRSPWDSHDYQELSNKAPFRTLLLSFPHTGPFAFLVYYILPPEIQILRMGVCPKLRCRGLSSRILAFLELYAIHNQINTLWLEVHTDNQPALNLYRKQGFTLVLKRKSYYQNPPRDALVMKKEVVTNEKEWFFHKGTKNKLKDE